MTYAWLHRRSQRKETGCRETPTAAASVYGQHRTAHTQRCEQTKAVNNSIRRSHLCTDTKLRTNKNVNATEQDPRTCAKTTTRIKHLFTATTLQTNTNINVGTYDLRISAQTTTAQNTARNRKKSSSDGSGIRAIVYTQRTSCTITAKRWHGRKGAPPSKAQFSQQRHSAKACTKLLFKRSQYTAAA